MQLRRSGQPDSTIRVPFGRFPFDLPTADDIELWHDGVLIQRVAHGHQSCTAKLHRASGRPLPAGTDTLARWEWRTAAQIAEDGRTTPRNRR